MAVVYVALGGNLGEPLATLRRAADELAALDRGGCFAVSSFYRSVPMGPQDQPDYINAVARFGTDLEPLPLLDVLQGIEHAHGRVRGAQRWGARTLDLDLLLFGDRVIDQVRLQVPHPGLAERNFVLYPLAELDPGLVLPDGTAVSVLRERVAAGGLYRLS